ncbi:hypothetical protein HpEKA17_07640 [Helicobacter pylori]
MEENRDYHAIVANVVNSLERDGSFSPSDRKIRASRQRAWD